MLSSKIQSETAEVQRCQYLGHQPTTHQQDLAFLMVSPFALRPGELLAHDLQHDDENPAEVPRERPEL